MQDMQTITSDIVYFNKNLYLLDAIFRAIADRKWSNSVIVKEDSDNYIASFCGYLEIDEKNMFITSVNLQMVRIKLENQFENLRNLIVERALSVNRTS